MLGRTHVAFALVVGSALAPVVGKPLDGSALIPLVAGSLIPDIDNPNTKLGWIFPKKLFGNCRKHPSQHRSWPHSIWMMAAGFAINFWFGVGIATHLALDMLNPSRIPLFYPLRAKVGINLVRSGGLGDFAFFAILLVVLCVQTRMLDYVMSLA